MMNQRTPGRVVRVAISFVAAVAVVAACSDQSRMPPTSTTIVPFTTTADGAIDTAGDWVRYVEIALDVLEDRHRMSGEVDWESVRSEALAILTDQPTQLQAHRAIEAAVVMIGDPHTFFLRPEAAQARNDLMPALPPPTGSVVDGRIGYLNLPSSGVSGEVGRLYASTLHDLARDIAASSVCGWVIDLRDHQGGSIVPPLLGLGPFLGEGAFVTSQRRDGTGAAYSYREGRLLVNGEPIRRDTWVGVPIGPLEAVEAADRLYTEPFVLADPNVAVAVLISFRTASAGEWVAVAFKGREATRFFGEPTLGVTTGNTAVTFDDDGQLVVTGSVAVDRLGNAFDLDVSPDQVVRTIPDSGRDETLDAAVSWLFDEPSCTD